MNPRISIDDADFERLSNGYPLKAELDAAAERMEALVARIRDDEPHPWECSCGERFAFLTSRRFHEIATGHEAAQ